MRNTKLSGFWDPNTSHSPGQNTKFSDKKKDPVDSLKSLSLMSTEDGVKLSLRIRLYLSCSDNSVQLSIVKQKENIIDMKDLAPLDYHLFDSMKKSFRSQTIYQWRESENLSEVVVLRTVNRILRGRDTCFHSKVEYCYW